MISPYRNKWIFLAVPINRSSRYTIILVILTACVLTASGCITATFHEKRVSDISPVNELTPMQDRTPYITLPSEILYHGRYAGQTETDGKQYHITQFDGFLAGENRYLTIRLPSRLPEKEYNDNSDTVELIETAEQQPGSSNAYLIYTSSGNLRKELSNDVTNLSKSSAANLDPYSILNTHFNYNPQKKDYPVILAVFDTSCPFNNELFFYYFIWEKGQEKPVITAGGFDRLTYEESLDGIRWVKRNRTLYTAGFLVYPLCAISDIVLLPVYIVLFPIFIDQLQKHKS